jgi:LacI family transcriptional regulator
MKASIRDVAREANVSISTVSRVINKNYPVKEETKIRVEAVVKKLNFSPNTLARSLISQNTKTIGILVPSINNFFFPTVIKAIEHELRINGYSIYLCDTDNNDAEETKYIKLLMGRQVDGIIVIDPKTENMKNGFYETVGKDIPLVSINGYNDNINCNFVLDVSIIGFDNICISSIVEPKLTTVDQNMYLLGENASKMLLEIIESDNNKIRRIELKTQLIIRNSCSNI